MADAETGAGARAPRAASASGRRLDQPPPYSISNGDWLAPLGFHSIPVTALHSDGTAEYDAHNLYGLSEAAATHAALRRITGKRPFILSRCVLDQRRSRGLLCGVTNWWSA